MNDYQIGDITYNRETDEIEQFLIFWQDGEPDTRRATPENMLLFDPEDELPFEGGMHDFLAGDSALQLSEDPLVVVGQSGSEYKYILNVQGDIIETTPEQAEDLLQAVYEAIANEDTHAVESFHADVIADQVRRRIVNALIRTFEQSHRIEVTANGWLVDGFYLVDWNAKMYVASDDRESGDYVRGQGGVVEKDESYEFVRMNHSLGNFEAENIVIDGEQYTLTEREMLFLTKVTWLLHRRHYHPDEPFWRFNDRWADVNVDTGLPEVDDDEPNLDQFNL